MDKYDRWIEEYKHLTGAHNQKKHGARGGAKVSQAAANTAQPKLSANGQKMLTSLEKNPDRSADYLKTVMPKVHAELLSKGYIGADGKLTSNANAKGQQPKSTVVHLKLDNKDVDVNDFQTKNAKLTEVVKMNERRTRATFDAKKREDIEEARLNIKKWARDNTADGRVTNTTYMGSELRNGVMARQFSFSMYDSGKRSTIPGATSMVNPNDHEIKFDFWVAS